MSSINKEWNKYQYYELWLIDARNTNLTSRRMDNRMGKTGIPESL